MSIGSDLPFFFSSGQALVRGRGEKIEETLFSKDYQLVLIKPDIAVSTARAYAELKLDLTKVADTPTFPRSRGVEIFLSSLRSLANDFEETQEESIPVLGWIRESLQKAGASMGRMSGSGPTMIGIFDRTLWLDKDTVCNMRDWESYVVLPISLPKEV